MKGKSQLKQMFLAQLRMTLREKQAWFWGIFFPVILMVIFMVIFSGGSEEEFSAKVVFVQEQSDVESSMLLEMIRYIPVLEAVEDEVVSREEAEELVKDGKVAAAIVMPEREGEPVTLVVNKEKERSSTTMTVMGILSQVVQEANLAEAGAVSKYSVDMVSVSSGNNDLNYQDFLLTGMIALSIAQGGLFGMVDMVEMRRKGLLKRLRMTPARMGLFGFTDMIMRALFSIVQIILLSLIGVFGFGATLYIDFLSLAVVFLFGVLSFNAMGYFFSSFSKTTEAYMGIANITSFLMMFLSGVFFPIESMPAWLRPVSDALPLTYFVNGLRESMIYANGLGLGSFWIGIAILVAWGAITFALGSLIYRNNRSIVAR